MFMLLYGERFSPRIGHDLCALVDDVLEFIPTATGVNLAKFRWGVLPTDVTRMTYLGMQPLDLFYCAESGWHPTNFNGSRSLDHLVHARLAYSDRMFTWSVHIHRPSKAIQVHRALRYLADAREEAQDIVAFYALKD